MVLQKKRMQYKAFLVSCIVLIAGAFASASYAVNLVTNFPDNQGSSGLYVQAFNPTTLQQRDLADTGSFTFGTPGQASNRVLMNISASKVLLSPCVNGVTYGTEWAVLTYQVSKTGLYDIAGTFFGSRNGCNAQANIMYNYNTVSMPFSKGIVTNNAWDFNFTKVQFYEGDYISFAIDALVSHSDDSISLTGSINESLMQTPEPTSIATLLLGLTGILAIRRKK